VEALHAFERYLSDGSDEVPEERKAAVRKEIAELRPNIATVTVTTNVPGATITVDDVPVGQTPIAHKLLVNPGRRKISATKAGMLPATKSVVFAGSDVEAVQLDLVELPKSQQPVQEEAIKPAWVPWASPPASRWAPAWWASWRSKPTVIKTTRSTPRAPPRATTSTARTTRRGALSITADVLTASAVVMGGIGLYLTFHKSENPGLRPARAHAGRGEHRRSLLGETDVRCLAQDAQTHLLLPCPGLQRRFRRAGRVEQRVHLCAGKTTDQCTVNSDCVGKFGDGQVCRKSDNTCQALVTTQCPYVYGTTTPDNVDNAIYIGVIISLTGPYGSGYRPYEAAARTAIEDFRKDNDLPPPPARRAKRAPCSWSSATMPAPARMTTPPSSRARTIWWTICRCRHHRHPLHLHDHCRGQRGHPAERVRHLPSARAPTSRAFQTMAWSGVRALGHLSRPRLASYLSNVSFPGFVRKTAWRPAA